MENNNASKDNDQRVGSKQLKPFRLLKWNRIHFVSVEKGRAVTDGKGSASRDEVECYSNNCERYEGFQGHGTRFEDQSGPI
jgi:hypothetical protein